MQAIDLLRAAWILFIFFLAFFLFPGYLFSARNSSSLSLRFAGNFVRALLIATIAGVLLASLKCLNATTVVSLVLGVTAIAWVRKNGKTSRDWLHGLQEAAIKVVRLVEDRAIFRPLDSSASTEPRTRGWLAQSLEGRETVVAAFVFVLLTTCALFFSHPLRELRLDRPEQYQVLLRARELMLNLHAYQRPIIFPSVIAMVSFLSSADPMQVIRFLSPVFELFIVLVAGLLIRQCTRGSIAAIAGMYCLGAAALQPAVTETPMPLSTTAKLESFFRTSLTAPGSSPEFGIGLLCLLLALVFLV
ncbi:MAG: hypothetical protein WBR26_27105, partial [Candidatus Acidiferrum sp.]